MSKTIITSISNSKTIDYGNELIKNFWLKRNGSTIEKLGDTHNLIDIIKQVQDSVICIQTESLTSPDVIKAIAYATTQRNRIYILTNKKNSEIAALAGSCLIRYGLQNISSFILVNPNKKTAKGIISTSAITEASLVNPNNIVLATDTSQTKILFRFFCDNFWNNASHEIIGDYLHPEETAEPPLDFLPNLKDFCDAPFIKEKLSQLKKDLTTYLPRIHEESVLKYPEIMHSSVLTNLAGNDDGLLKKLIQSGNEIYANDTSIPFHLILSDKENWLIPKGKIVHKDKLWALQLNTKQRTFLSKQLKKSISTATFQFQESEKRVNLAKQQIRRQQKNILAEENILPASEKTGLEVRLKELLTKEEFEIREPDFKDDNISVKITYDWQVIPFQTPSKAKKAILYDEWDKQQQKLNGFLNEIEINITKLSSQDSVKEKLKRFFLSKSMEANKHKTLLQNLKLEILSDLIPQQRKAKVTEINDLAQKVIGGLKEVENEVNKFKIEEEITRFETNKIEKGKEKIIKEEELATYNEKYTEDLNSFLETHGKTESQLKIFRNELGQKAGNKHKRKNPEEAKVAKKTLDELNELIKYNFSNQLKSNIDDIVKAITKIDSNINMKQKQLQKIGQEMQANSGSSLDEVIGHHPQKNNKKNIQYKQFHIPDNMLHLPTVGILYEVSNQRFLEIEFWEDYNKGKNEASRLNAKLSAKTIKT